MIDKLTDVSYNMIDKLSDVLYGCETTSHALLMDIELHYNDGSSQFAEICRTELNAPSVLEHKGKFFLKTPVDSRLYAGVNKYLLYRECRGEVLNSIQIVRSHSEEVA